MTAACSVGKFAGNGKDIRTGGAISFIPYFGYAAGVLTVLSFMPQLVRAWKTQRVRDLSTGMFVLLITSAALWLTYGVLIGDWPVILTNGGVVLLNSGILTAKIRYRHNP